MLAYLKQGDFPPLLIGISFSSIAWQDNHVQYLGLVAFSGSFMALLGIDKSSLRWDGWMLTNAFWMMLCDWYFFCSIYLFHVFIWCLAWVKLHSSCMLWNSLLMLCAIKSLCIWTAVYQSLVKFKNIKLIWLSCKSLNEIFHVSSYARFSSFHWSAWVLIACLNLNSNCLKLELKLDLVDSLVLLSVS